MQSLDFTSEVAVSPYSSNSTESNAEASTSTKECWTACGFRFWLKAQRSSSGVGDQLEIYLLSEPEPFCSDSYQLITDYHLTLLESSGGERSAVPFAGISVRFELIVRGYSETPEDERWTLRVGWDEAVKCLKASTADQSDQSPSYSCVVRCQIRIRDLLTAHKENYNDESLPRRDFALLLGRQRQLYVDLQYLADQGSEYFRDLLESKQKGVRRAVLMNTDATEMEIFLDAVCTHRKAVITNRNFDIVLRIAQEYGVDKVLRACEAYLIDTDAMHPIRKLEYAAEFGLGLLGETVVRQLTDSKPMAALLALHDYLRLNNETVDQMHPDVLNSLNIFDGYVVL